MAWEILVVPLIALGVWILGTLFKGEDDRTKRGAARRPGGAPGRGQARRPVTDLDRFLDEARRRREMEERRKKAPTPPPRPTESRPPLRERPAPRPTPPRSVPSRQDVPDAISVPRPAPVPPPPPVREVVIETIPVVPLPQPVIEAAPPPPPAPAKVRQEIPSPIAQQVRALLSKRQTAGAAFVLREILDRPRCMRRR